MALDQVLRDFARRRTGQLEAHDFGQQRRGRPEAQLAVEFQRAKRRAARTGLIEVTGDDHLAIEGLVVAQRGRLARVDLTPHCQSRGINCFAAPQLHGQFLPDQLEQVAHLQLPLIERSLLAVLPVQALDGNGQFVCHRVGAYASFHPGPPMVYGRHHTPVCISYGGPILLLLLYFSLHQDKITPDELELFSFLHETGTEVVFIPKLVGHCMVAGEPF